MCEVIVIAEEDKPNGANYHKEGKHTFLHLLQPLHSHFSVSIHKHEAVVSAITIVHLLDSRTRIDFDVLGPIFAHLKTEKIKAFCLDLLIETVHCLFDFEIFLEEHTDQGEVYNDCVGYLRVLGAALCLAKQTGMQSGCLCLIVLSSCYARLSSSAAYSSISSAIFLSSYFLPFLNIIIQISNKSIARLLLAISSKTQPQTSSFLKNQILRSVLYHLYLLYQRLYDVSTLLVAILFYNMGGEQQKKQSSLDYKDVQNGPLTQANRECRDLFCCLFFLINIVWMCYATGVAYSTGNTTKIFRPISAVVGEICGQPGNSAEAYPYIYFSNPMDLQNRRFCVMSCPSGTDATFTTTAAGGGTITFDVSIASDGTATPSSWASGDDVGYFSSVAAGRVCVPSTETFNKAFSSYTSTFASLQQGDLANFILDVKNNWQWLLAAFGFAILISFIFMYMLRCLAGCIVWCSIFGIILFFTGAGLVFLYNAGVITGFGNYSGYLSIPSSSASQNNYQVYGYISFGFAGLFLLITLCCCSRIRLAVAVCKAAGQFVASVCTSVLVPIFQTIFALGLWGGCLVVMVFLVSTANFYIANNSDYFTSVKYGDSGLINLYIFIFSTLWANALIQAIGIFVIASACAMWYYSHGPEQTLDFPILRSYKMAFRFHFGSLAFGSLVLAIVQFLELMVQAFKKQAEAAGGENKCTQCLTNFLRCCLACVERIVEFINKTAYIQIAIRGKSFCYAAKDGFEMVFSNVLRYSIVSGVGSILMFIGKLLIALGTAGAFYLLIIYYPGARINVLQPIYLLVIVFIMAYAVGVLFMVVYTLAMDTLLACFIIDEANSKAKGGKAPQYAPEELAVLMEAD